MRRLLKIAVTVTCLVACLALAGLWVRSFNIYDSASGPFTEDSGFAFGSVVGRITFVAYYNVPSAEIFDWAWHQLKVSRNDQMNERWGLNYYNYSKGNVGGINVVVPHWFPILIFALLAAAPWVHWRRFTVRTLLVAMAVVAVVMGLAVATN